MKVSSCLMNDLKKEKERRNIQRRWKEKSKAKESLDEARTKILKKEELDLSFLSLSYEYHFFFNDFFFSSSLGLSELLTTVGFPKND